MANNWVVLAGLHEVRRLNTVYSASEGLAAFQVTALPSHRGDGKTGNLQISQSFFPINELPDDVLYEIWSHIIGLYGVHDDDSYKASSRLLVSQVCRHWRTLALSSPFLWTNILLISPQYTSMMIERSGQALLSVLVTPNGMSRAQLSLCMKYVFQHGDRLCRLDMTHTPPLRHALDNCLHRGLGVGPPVLDTVVMRYRFEWSVNVADTSRHLPLPVMASNVKNLRVEAGTIGLVKSLTGNFPCVTNLKVSFNPYQIPELGELLDMLRALPQLERLHFHTRTVLVRRIPQPPLGDPKVATLDQLRYLTIEDLNCAQIFNFLIFPTTTSVVVNLHRDTDFCALTSEQLFHKIATACTGLVKSNLSRSISEFVTAMVSYEEEIVTPFSRRIHLILRLWCSSQARTIPSLQSANITINFAMIRYSRTEFNAVLDWINPLPSVTAFTLLVDIPEEYRYSTALFKLFPNAITMTLDGKRYQSLHRRSISSTSSKESLILEYDQRSPERLLAGLKSRIRDDDFTLPYLQELVMSNLNWCGHHRKINVSDHDKRVEPLVDRLLDVLYTREKAGLRLKKLLIDGPYNLDSIDFGLINSSVGVDQVEKTSDSRRTLCDVCRFLEA